MGKRLKLATRAFGAEPDVPDVAKLAKWVAECRGTSADLILYRLNQSLTPQLSAEITAPCAGGKFYQDRIMECLLGVKEGMAVDELGVRTDTFIEDATGIVAQKKGVWCALPAPHALGITDTYYNDKDEWSDAITGVYRTLMRAMRDAGIGGHVLICDTPNDAEISGLVRQKVFFFQPDPDRESLQILMEQQWQVAVGKNHLETVFDLASEYELGQIIIIDADDESLALSLSRFDPDQIIVGGYCTDNCETYWKELIKSATYSK